MSGQRFRQDDGPVIISFPFRSHRAEERKKRAAQDRVTGRVAFVIVGLCLGVVYMAVTVGHYGVHPGLAVLLYVMACVSALSTLWAIGDWS